MNITAMEKIVSATREAEQAKETLHKLTGDQDTILDSIYGMLIDALYEFSGENTSELNDSLTFKLLQNHQLSDATVAEMLLSDSAK